MPDYDVVIYGATPSGCMAAVMAARLGLSVAVVEQTAFRGGMITGGLGISDAAATRTWWGPTQEWVNSIAAETGITNEQRKWNFAASMATEKMNAILDAENIDWFMSEWAVAVEKNDITLDLGAQVRGLAGYRTRIVALHTNARTLTAKQFIDASYEGDLLPLAGVPCVAGREARSTYGDPRAGRNDDAMAIRNYNVLDGDGDLWPRAQHEPIHQTGQADNTIMAYGFRLMVTNREDTIVPWPAPPGYRREDFLPEIWEANNRGVSRAEIDAGFIVRRAPEDEFGHTAIDPPAKFATNGSDIIGPDAWEWCNLTPPERRVREDRMAYRMLGRFYTFANDQDVPESIRDSFSEFGLCNDEFQSEYILTPGWSHTLYVREGRRMIGQAVVTWKEGGKQLNWPDQVGVAGYFSDSKASYQYQVAGENQSTREGRSHDPYENFVYWGVPMRALVPSPGIADNLIVPVGASITGMLHGSYRLEPIWMAMGQVAAVMAHEAIAADTDAALLRYGPVEARLQSLNAVFRRYG